MYTRGKSSSCVQKLCSISFSNVLFNRRSLFFNVQAQVIFEFCVIDALKKRIDSIQSDEICLSIAQIIWGKMIARILDVSKDFYDEFLPGNLIARV